MTSQAQMAPKRLRYNEDLRLLLSVGKFLLQEKEDKQKEKNINLIRK